MHRKHNAPSELQPPLPMVVHEGEPSFDQIDRSPQPRYEGPNYKHGEHPYAKLSPEDIARNLKWIAVVKQAIRHGK